jgi:GT2 family glycosyltransferase
MSERATNEAQALGSRPESGPPLVSVVIPAYNSSAYIAAALESVFRQTFSSYEVIVINDGSPDTAALESALQPFLARLRYFRQENRGPSAARNFGIREARGRYIALLDSDDAWLPDHLARQIDHLTRDPELGLVYSNNTQFRDGRAIGNAFDKVPQTGPVTLESLLAEQCTVNTSSVVVLRESLFQAGLFDESLRRCEDFDLWLRLASHGVRMTYDPEVQVLHRLGHGLSSNFEGMKRGRAEVYKKAMANLSLNATQQGVVAAKLKGLEIQIEVESAKEHLEAGRFGEARMAIQRANSLARSRKLRLVEAGLRVCPLLMRWSYDGYVQSLRWFRRKARSAGGRGGSELSNFDISMRPRPVP